MRILVVDHFPSPEGVALLAMVRAQPPVQHVVGAGGLAEAMRLLSSGWIDVMLLNTSLPWLSGPPLSSLLSRLGQPPVVVFVAEDDLSAVAMSDAGAIATMRIPVRPERLAVVLDRAAVMLRGLRARPGGPVDQPDALPVLTVEQRGRTVVVHRDDVHIAEAHGNVVRLHTATARYELRMSLSALEEHWTQCGFLRVHRSYLVSVGAVRQLRNDALGAELIACTDAGEARVSRRNASRLRQALRNNRVAGSSRMRARA